MIRAFGFQKHLEPSQNTTSRKRRSFTTTNAYVKSNTDFQLNPTNGFSFLLRTRQENGFVALLLDKAAIGSKDTSYQYILIEIVNKHLRISAKRQGDDKANVVNTPGTMMVSNGKQLEIKLDSDSLQVGSQTENLATAFALHVKVVYLGGVEDQTLYTNVFRTPSLDGCLQAVDLGGNFLTNQALPSALTVAVTRSTGVQDSCPGTPVCDDSPCKFNGECVDEWNDFRCRCQTGYSGKTCTTFGCRLNNTCANPADCVDVPLTYPPMTRCKSLFCFIFHLTGLSFSAYDILRILMDTSFVKINNAVRQ